MSTVTETSRFDNTLSPTPEEDWDWTSSMHPEPDPEPADMALELEAIAAYHRCQGTDFGAWLARQLDDLAAQARFLHALTPDIYEDRLGELERGTIGWEEAADRARLRHLTPSQQSALARYTAVAYHGQTC